MTIDERTQEIIKLQIGDLVLVAARRKAEVEFLTQELEKLSPPPPPEPPA